MANANAFLDNLLNKDKEKKKTIIKTPEIITVAPEKQKASSFIDSLVNKAPKQSIAGMTVDFVRKIAREPVVPIKTTSNQQLFKTLTPNAQQKTDTILRQNPSLSTIYRGSLNEYVKKTKLEEATLGEITGVDFLTGALTDVVRSVVGGVEGMTGGNIAESLFNMFGPLNPDYKRDQQNMPIQPIYKETKLTKTVEKMPFWKKALVGALSKSNLLGGESPYYSQDPQVNTAAEIAFPILFQEGIGIIGPSKSVTNAWEYLTTKKKNIPGAEIKAALGEITSGVKAKGVSAEALAEAQKLIALNDKGGEILTAIRKGVDVRVKRDFISWFKEWGKAKVAQQSDPAISGLLVELNTINPKTAPASVIDKYTKKAQDILDVKTTPVAPPASMNGMTVAPESVPETIDFVKPTEIAGIVNPTLSIEGEIPKVEPQVVPKEKAQEEVKPKIVIDVSEVQEIKNSIAEGELLLKEEKDAGKRFSIQRAINNSKLKIGESPKAEIENFDSTVQKDISKAKQENKALVIAADEYKTRIPGYKDELADYFHGESSKLIDRVFPLVLKDPYFEKAIFMGGGPGSGKTEVGIKSVEGSPKTFILDGTFATKRAYNSLKQAIEAGKDVSITAVYTDPLKAYIFKNQRDRALNDEAFIKKHAGFREMMVKVATELPNIKINIIENKGNIKGSINLSFDNHQELIDYLKENLYSEAEIRSLITDYDNKNAIRNRQQGVGKTDTGTDGKGRDIERTGEGEVGRNKTGGQGKPKVKSSVSEQILRKPKKAVSKKLPKSLSPQEAAVKVMPRSAGALPILKEFKVKSGKLMATDLEIAIKLDTDLPDGMYKMMGKDAVRSPSDASDFPLIPDLQNGKSIFKINSQDFIRVVSLASEFAHKDNIRPVLAGMLVKAKEGHVVVTATDGYTLYTQSIKTKTTGEGEFILTEPNKISKVLPAIDTEGSVEFIVDDTMVNIKGKNGEIFIIQVSGQYPLYERIFPVYENQYTLNKNELLQVLKDLNPYTKNSLNNKVEIEFKDGKLTAIAHDDKLNITKQASIPASFVKVETQGGQASDGILLMPIKAEGNGSMAGYNINYLIKSVKASDDTFYFYNKKDNNAPAFLSKDKNLNKQKLPVKPIKTKAPSGIASSGAGDIGGFEILAGDPNKTTKEFKLYEQVKALIQKYAKSIGEDYLPSNSLGVYYEDSGNIRIKGMNDVSVAAHEITHFLDFAYKISDRLRGVVGYASNGNPIYDPTTAAFRKEMTDVYTQYYPGASKKHKLKKRMIEGFATLLQKYIEQPTTVSLQFPKVVANFLKEEGRFYEPVMGEIIKDLRALIENYQGLPSLDKIGARVVSDAVNVNKDSFLTFIEKVKTEIADEIYPIEKLAKKTGVYFTQSDPSLWLRQYSNSNALILNNINGDKGFWGWRNDNLVKLHDFNWKTLITDLKDKGITDEFAFWLVARREHFAFAELPKLELDLKVAGEAVKNAVKIVQDAKEAGADIGEYYQEMKAVKESFEQAKIKYESAKSILKNDGFTQQEVDQAYLENKDRFVVQEKQYDILVKEDLNFLNDPNVGLVDSQQYSELTSKEGYASFKRYFYDEIVGEDQGGAGMTKVGKIKISSLLKRSGSKKPIINPLFSALTNHAEITRKGLRQIVANKIYDISDNLPDLFQKVPLKAVPDGTGKILFPQEKDPSLIIARKNYVRKALLTDSTIKRVVDEVLTPQNINIFEKLLMAGSRFFTKGTTGLFPGFALSNTTIDQITAVGQTKNNYIPLYDGLYQIAKSLSKKTVEHSYMQEYMVMGGERQTMVGWQDLSPNELFDTIKNERKGLLKVLDAINSGMNVLALPAKWSEIMTRAGEYIKARKAGKSQIVALEEAGRVTAPFHHIGRWGGGRTGKTIVKSIPFFNPSIEVLAQSIESLSTKKGAKRYMFTVLAVTAASIAATAALMEWGTEEQKQLLADLSAKELEAYIYYPNFDGKTLNRIRVPDQMNVFATLINMAIIDKPLKADYSGMEYIDAATSWIPAQFNVTDIERMFISWIPQIIKPGILTLAGVKDYPKIIPLESQTQQAKTPGQRSTETTSPVAKWLGSKLDISPIKIDYLVTGYLGRATGFITGKPGAYNPFKAMNREYYFSSGRHVQKFYDLKESNTQKLHDYNSGILRYSSAEMKYAKDVNERTKSITKLLKDYNDLDLDVEIKKATESRNKILAEIYQLEALKETDPNSMANLALLYSEAASVDLDSALNALFTAEQLAKVEGKTAIFKRMSLNESEAVKLNGGAGKDDKLDHTIPLQLGGDNSKGNLKIVTYNEWKKYTPVENYLGKLLYADKITEKEAVSAIKDFKNGKITAEQVRARYK